MPGKRISWNQSYGAGGPGVALGVRVGDLQVNSEGLRAAAAALGEPSAASALGIAGISGVASQTSVDAVRGIAAHLSSWHLDESGYHTALAETLSAASHRYQAADEQGGHRIGGVM